jgi:glycerol-3-phosphate dehydrogenase (NAD(P)+)
MGPTPSRILILGRGAMGSMFDKLLSPRHEVEIWHRGLEADGEPALEALGRDRDIVIFALPTQPHARLAERLAACLDRRTVCLSIAKGVDEQARTPAEIFAETLGPDRHWGMIYGPMIARDLSEGRPGFAVLAGNSEAARAAAGLFADTRLYLDVTDDLTGAAWSVVLKNVFVPLLGATDALELGDNIRGFLIYEAVRELETIMIDLGGRRETARGLAGMGDLITSATSKSSHHRTIGAELVAGRSDKIAAGGEYIRSEGVHTARRVRERGTVARGSYPLFELACDFVTGPLDLERVLYAYLENRFARTTGAVSTEARPSDAGNC